MNWDWWVLHVINLNTLDWEPGPFPVISSLFLTYSIFSSWCPGCQIPHTLTDSLLAAKTYSSQMAAKCCVHTPSSSACCLPPGSVTTNNRGTGAAAFEREWQEGRLWIHQDSGSNPFKAITCSKIIEQVRTRPSMRTPREANQSPSLYSLNS